MVVEEIVTLMSTATSPWRREWPEGRVRRIAVPSGMWERFVMELEVARIDYQDLCYVLAFAEFVVVVTPLAAFALRGPGAFANSVPWFAVIAGGLGLVALGFRYARQVFETAVRASVTEWGPTMEPYMLSTSFGARRSAHKAIPAYHFCVVISCCADNLPSVTNEADELLVPPLRPETAVAALFAVNRNSARVYPEPYDIQHQSDISIL
jgi:hypothetical protein